MSNVSQNSFDVLVIGGGPAGIAAAVRAAESGVRVGIVDDNPALGGQIWRGESANAAASDDASRWYALLQKVSVTKLCGYKVFHQPEPGVLLAEGPHGVCELRYLKLVIATGARERFLPFPGWTLPNVMGAGGLQAMVKAGLPIRDKRVVITGTGPLLLAVAAYLRKHGANVPLICEQTGWRSLARFGLTVLGSRSKISQGLQLRKEIKDTRFCANSWVVAAHGKDMLQEVAISRNAKVETIPCDYLACGFHLVPNTELAILMGCRLRNGFVQVDDLQQTSVQGIYCAGEPTGIGGLELSLIEGQIAGFAAASKTEKARFLFSQRDKYRRFARSMDAAFCLRSELRNLASAETIVCRCEDVPFSRLQEHTSWRAAKLYTRCGMGPCQGRICGSATQFLFRWTPDSVRPPVFPATVENLARTQTQIESELAVTGGHS